MCLTAFWDRRHHLECAQHVRNTAVLCHLCPASPAEPAAACLENWNSGPLTVAQAGYEAPASGVTPFEDFIRSWRLIKHRMKHKLPPGHSTDSARRSLFKTQIGQHTDESVHYMSGESRVLPPLRLPPAVVQSDALSRVSDPDLSRRVCQRWPNKPRQG